MTRQLFFQVSVNRVPIFTKIWRNALEVNSDSKTWWLHQPSPRASSHDQGIKSKSLKHVMGALPPQYRFFSFNLSVLIFKKVDITITVIDRQATQSGNSKKFHFSLFSPGVMSLGFVLPGRWVVIAVLPAPPISWTAAAVSTAPAYHVNKKIEKKKPPALPIYYNYQHLSYKTVPRVDNTPKVGKSRAAAWTLSLTSWASTLWVFNLRWLIAKGLDMAVCCVHSQQARTHGLRDSETVRSFCLNHHCRFLRTSKKAVKSQCTSTVDNWAVSDWWSSYSVDTVSRHHCQMNLSLPG